jgi:2-oxo-4-hydroxy-4-carboxy-5-ureidoimidazoline decarboxylase
MRLDELNRLPELDAADALRRCCGADVWVQAMCAGRPFRDRAHLLQAAEGAAEGLSREDWLEAFGSHPRIGDRDALRRRFASTAAWASEEQRGAGSASDSVLEGLARSNEEYLRRFGYIFIVCATGKSAEEMLALLQARLGNDATRELAIAALEQRKITRLRLEKLVEDP